MQIQAGSEVIDQARRQLLATAAWGVAVAGVASLLPAQPAAATTTSDAIRPFRVDVPEQDLADLRRRVLATRWPDRETVADQSQGVQLAKLRQLVRYWGTATTGARWKRG